MSGVRVLVGTRKGAFVLTSDGKRQQWDVSGPHFGGWEVYHVKGSPADPNRLYASQSSGWFGQVIQRSNDGGRTWGCPVIVHRTNPDFNDKEAIVADTSPTSPRVGNVYAAWDINVRTGNTTRQHLVVSRSNDNGASWSAPARTAR